MYSFFFQAEDGIRDLTVTGVQTCALPIFAPAMLFDDPLVVSLEGLLPREPEPVTVVAHVHHLLLRKLFHDSRGRSEERRVGKECRSGWWLEHSERNVCEGTLVLSAVLAVR